MATSTSVRALVRNVVLDRIPGVLRRGPATSRRVALTFDGGPDALTPRYLDLLDSLGVPATFFLLGARVARRPELVREYLRRGHQLASHGYGSARSLPGSRRDLIAQCNLTEQALGGQISGRPWVRPPDDARDAASIMALLTARYTVALWSLDVRDSNTDSAHEIAERCAPNQASGGEVLRLREGLVQTVEALPRIVHALQGAGLECVTMHDLFAT